MPVHLRRILISIKVLGAVVAFVGLLMAWRVRWVGRAHTLPHMTPTDYRVALVIGALGLVSIGVGCMAVIRPTPRVLRVLSALTAWWLFVIATLAVAAFVLTGPPDPDPAVPPGPDHVIVSLSALILGVGAVFLGRRLNAWFKRHRPDQSGPAVTLPPN